MLNQDAIANIGPQASRTERHIAFIFVEQRQFFAQLGKRNMESPRNRTFLSQLGGVTSRSTVRLRSEKVLKRVSLFVGILVAEGIAEEMAEVKEIAEELHLSTNTIQTFRVRILEKISAKFGTWKGSVAEMASHGFSADAVVAELMKNSSATGQQPQPYFMDTTFTVMGVGCASVGTPGPICVITLASEFNEAQ